MKLVIAEKPSVARSIAAVIGADQKKDGYLEGGGYLVSWCVGHLVELAAPERYGTQYEKWRYEDLPILPGPWKYEVKAGVKDQYQTLKKLIQDERVESLVCATDAGREGELIFRLVYHMTGSKKPFERLWISSMEEQAIQEGFENLKPGSTESSKNYSIEIYNAAYVSGLAGQWESYLESEGYSISLVDSYQEEGPLSQTRINVTQDGMGQDLLTYFPDAEINVVDSISTGGDIQIYIGTDSTNVPAGSDSTTDTEDETVTDSSLDDESDSTDSTDSTDVGDDDDTTTSGGYDFGSDSEQ